MKLRPESLLRQRVVLRTRDPVELNNYIVGMEGTHERQVELSGDVKFELRRQSIGRVDIGLFYSSVPIVLKATRRAPDAYLLQFPLSGSIDLEIDGRAILVVPDSGVIVSPGQRVCRSATPGWTLALRIPGDLIRSRFIQRVGHSLRDSLEFRALISGAAEDIRCYCLLIIEAIDRCAASPGSAVAEVLEEGLVDLLLTLQPHSQGRALVDASAAERSERIRAVTQHVDKHVRESLTVERLARVAGCSVRALQATFIEISGLSPMEYVRRRRLAFARQLLESADGETTVSAVASLVGLSHLSRFASSYRAMYGEAPSETLRRAAMHSIQVSLP